MTIKHDHSLTDYKYEYYDIFFIWKTQEDTIYSTKRSENVIICTTNYIRIFNMKTR